MLANGIDDILITFNILGSTKLARLRALSDRISALSVVAEKAEVVQGLGQALQGTTRLFSEQFRKSCPPSGPKSGPPNV